MAFRNGMSCGFVAAALLAILAIPNDATSQSLSTALVVPIDIGGLSARLAEEDAALGDFGRAARLDLWFPSGNAGNASLTMAEASLKSLWLGCGVLSLPSIDAGFSLSPCSIPFFAEGASFDRGLWSASFMLAAVPVPRIDMEAFSTPFDIASTQAFLLSGTLGYGSSSLRLFFADVEGSVEMSGMGPPGAFSGGLGFASLDFGSWGLLYGSALGNASITLKSFLSSFTSLPWVLGSGSVDFQFAAGWGSLLLGGTHWTAGVDAAVGLFWNLGSSANGTIIENGSATGALSWPLDIRSAGILIVHPSFGWTPLRGLKIGIGRWLPYYWYASSPASSGGSSPPVSSSTASLESLSLETILLSGIEVTVKYSM